MQDNTIDPAEERQETESAAGEIATSVRFVIGARTSLLLGLTAIGLAGVVTAFPSVSIPTN
jgi:hypothetical protein